jgi:phenylacetate-CoA ligase
VETKDGLHIWEDHFLPEVVDPLDGVPCRRRGGRAAVHLADQAGAADHPYRTRDLTAPAPGHARPGMRRMQKITVPQPTT